MFTVFRLRLFCHTVILLFSYSFISVKAYRIEISNPSIANTPVFLAGYYGEVVFVVDSAMTDAGGIAVFERHYDLCVGMYTIVAPGKLRYDFLLDTEQQIKIDDWHAPIVDGQLDNENSLHAVYNKALQPVTSPDVHNNQSSIDNNQLMREYHYRRRNFFANMPLSDVRLLRTPLYHETIHYYFSQFVTQHADSLVHIAYSMLEQAYGDYETFYYISDFLIDYSLRNRNIENINRFYSFIQRNRDMLATRGMAMVPPRSSTNYFAIPDEKSLQERIENMHMTDVEGRRFFQQTINTKYRVFFFWKNDCMQCITEASRFQTIINRYANLSCFGIAVNFTGDVRKPENRILAYDPQCVNVSVVDAVYCETYFFVTNYPKIVVTDNAGNIVGLFASTASLDNFLKIAR